MNDVTENPVEEVEDVEANDPRDTSTSEATPAPTQEELAGICADIKANYNSQVNVKPVVFRFKTSKDADGVELKRDALELPIPYPSVQGIVDILEAGGKDLELLQDAVDSIITAQARIMITDDHGINAVNLDTSKLSWSAIANMPKAERSGGGIAKEVWEDFANDYIKTMPEVTGKGVEPITRAAKILQGKFASVKTNVEVINFLLTQIALYVENSKRVDEFTSCVEFLVDKADKLVNTTPEELLANL